MKENDKHFLTACQNLAGFIWGNWEFKGYATKEDLWNALPDSDKDQIRYFILAPKIGPEHKLRAESHATSELRKFGEALAKIPISEKAFREIWQ